MSSETPETTEEFDTTECTYLAGCRWPLGCDAEGMCIGADIR